MLKTELFCMCVGIGTKITENVPQLSSTMTLLLSWPDNENSWVGHKVFLQSIVLALLMDCLLLNFPQVDLPDVEFFINLGDWPLVKDSDRNIPIISWCGSNTTTDIILPTYDITDASLKSLSQYVIIIRNVCTHVHHSINSIISSSIYKLLFQYFVIVFKTNIY